MVLFCHVECLGKAYRSGGVRDRQGSVFPVPGVVAGLGGEARDSLKTLNNSSPHLSGLGRTWVAGGKGMDLISLTSFCLTSLIS